MSHANGTVPPDALHLVVVDASGAHPVVRNTASATSGNSSGSGDLDPIRRRFLETMLVANTSFTRAKLDTLLNPDRRRNYHHEYGWPEGSIDVQSYQDLYDHNPIAARVIEAWPTECWKVDPEIYEDEDADTETPFEQGWRDLAGVLRGGNSAFEDVEGGHPIWGFLHQADEQCGIGRYGIILVGIDDGLPLHLPAAGVTETGSMPSEKDPAESSDSMAAARETARNRKRAAPYSLVVNAEKTAGRKLLYLRVFPETLATILRYETNPASPRFGQPVMYQVTFNDPRMASVGSGASQFISTQDVHWTRVVHVVDNPGSNPIFGVPRMQQMYFNLLDVHFKLYGGLGEMYYQGAMPGYSFETPAGLAGANVDINKTAVKDAYEEYYNRVSQRSMVLENLTMKSQAPQVVDPTPQITAHLQAICIKMQMPMRVFMGTERGELASTQDQKGHDRKTRGRQRRHCTGRLAVPLMDRFVMLGVLPRPSRYGVHWPDVAAQSETEQADVALKRTQALAQYVAGGCEAVVAPADYLSRFQGMTEEEAETVVESAAERVEEEGIAEEALREEIETEMASQAQAQAGATAAARTAEGEDE